MELHSLSAKTTRKEIAKYIKLLVHKPLGSPTLSLSRLSLKAKIVAVITSAIGHRVIIALSSRYHREGSDGTCAQALHLAGRYFS